MHARDVAPGRLTVASTGYTAGGVDPCVTILSGAGTGATFVGSNHAQESGPGGDFA